ncbi:MAG: hypoxanthine phosphoribosyltransferase [Bacteroidales bacterium]|nr:hypoxanthine phosphoribosyltransferase [Bacteroidales bacterium]
MVNEITIHDKLFVKYIDYNSIKQKVKEIAVAISNDYSNKELVFICILNGAYMFASDLTKASTIESEIHFVKLSSYLGTKTSGIVSELIGLQIDIENKDVVVIEDIIDTGVTLQKIIEILQAKNPASVEVASLLFKPDTYKGQFKIKYFGFEIPDKFVVGYGLDYNNKGRTLKDIYQLKIS